MDWAGAVAGKSTPDYTETLAESIFAESQSREPGE